MSEINKFKFTKEIFTPTVRFRLLESGIIQYTYLLDSEVNDKEHQINHNTLLDFIKDYMNPAQKVLILVDSEGFNSISPEARKLIRELEKIVPILSRAIVITSLNERLLANFYITFNKPIIPTKIFKNYNEAIDWLFNSQQDYKQNTSKIDLAIE